MSNIQLKPVPQSQFDETKSAEDLFLSGYTDKDGARKNVRIKASSLVGSAHAKAYQGDILETKVFRLSSSEEMYMGTITSDVLLSETNASSCYGTLYLFIKNDTDKEHSITLPEGSYHFFPQSQNKIGIPAGSYIELAIKAYGVDRVVTNLSGLEQDEIVKYVAGKNISINGNVISAVDSIYDDGELLLRLKALENKLDTFLAEGGTIGGNLRVSGYVNGQKFLKDE